MNDGAADSRWLVSGGEAEATTTLMSEHATLRYASERDCISK